MLYNERWAETKLHPLADVMYWLRQQNPDTEYSQHVQDCAMARYAVARGIKLSTTVKQAEAVGLLEDGCLTFMRLFANTEPRTYGALLQRLEEYMNDHCTYP